MMNPEMSIHEKVLSSDLLLALQRHADERRGGGALVVVGPRGGVEDFVLALQGAPENAARWLVTGWLVPT